jgi:hypothetical protein
MSDAGNNTRAGQGRMTVGEADIIPLPVLAASLGLGPAALRTARRQGLKVRKIGRKKFVLGRDLVAFLERRECGQ